MLMIDLGIFYSNLATVGLIILLGFGLGKKKWLSPETNKQLTDILLSIAMPAALFMAFPREFHHDKMADFLFGLAGGLAISVVAIIISKLIFSKNRLKNRAEAHQFAFIFNNAGFNSAIFTAESVNALQMSLVRDKGFVWRHVQKLVNFYNILFVYSRNIFIPYITILY